MLDQLAEGAHHVFERHVRVVVVRLVEVDVIGLQALQRCIYRLADVLGAQADLAVAHLFAHLGGQHQLVALAGFAQPFADDALRFAALVAGRPAGVHVGGVNKVHAGV